MSQQLRHFRKVVLNFKHGQRYMYLTSGYKVRLHTRDTYIYIKSLRIHRIHTCENLHN